MLLSHLQPTYQEPDIRIDDAALDYWEHNQLANAETLLTSAVNASLYPSYHALASRALVRARLQLWDAAIADATQVLVALLSCMLMPTLILRLVHQNPAIHRWLRCKECSPCWQRAKARGISGVRHRVRTLSSISR